VELHNLYSSPDTVNVIKQMKMGHSMHTQHGEP